MHRYLQSFFLFFGLVVIFIHTHAAVVSVRVSSSNDDGEEQNPPNNQVYRNSTDLELAYDGNTRQHIGMRFQNISISQGTTINSAYIEFEVDEQDSGTTNVVILGEDTDDAGTFGNGANNITNRNRTSASVNWSIPAWTVVNSKQNSPDITPIIQEIINRPGWNSGNDLAIIVEPGTGCNSSACQRTAESYDGENANAPLLVIDYDSGGASSSCETFRDNFDTSSFANNDGSVNWSGNWIEVDGNGAGAGSGNAQISGGNLNLDDQPNTNGEPSLAREADLSSYDSATLSFIFSTTSGVDTSDEVILEISNNGGSSYSTLESFTGINGASSGSRNIDITTSMSANTRIRLRVSNLYGGGNETFQVDNFQVEACSSGPSVASINRADADPTSLSSVNWTVTFSENVTGVDATDFTLVSTGSLSGTSISNVSGSGTTWTVSATTGSGAGTLGLNLVDDDSIINATSNPLGGIGTGNGNFTGQVYTVLEPFDPADYTYSIQLSVTTGPNAPDKGYEGYTARLTGFDSQALISAGQMQSDCDDLRVVYDDGSTLTEVDRHLFSCNTADSDIRFMLQADIADNTTVLDYFIYHGYAAAGAPNAVTTTNVYRWYDDASIDRSADYTRGRIDAWHGSGWDDSLSWNAGGYYTFDTDDNFTSGYRIDVDERDALIEAEYYHTNCYPNNMTTGVMLRGVIDSGSGGSESSSHYYATNRGHNSACGGGYSEDGDIVKSARTTIAVDGANPASIVEDQWRKVALSAWGINGTNLTYWDDNNGWNDLAWPDAGSLQVSGIDTSDYESRGFGALIVAQDAGRVRNLVIRRYVDPEPLVEVVPPPAVDHFDIDLTVGGTPNTCNPFNFIITAQDSSNNTVVDYAGTVTITTSTSNGNFSAVAAVNNVSPNPDNDDNGSVSYTFDALDLGAITLALSNERAQTLTITVTDSSIPVVSTSASISFSDNVFIITDTDSSLSGNDNVPVAGRDHPFRIEMIKRDPVIGCGPAAGYTGTKPLKMWRNKSIASLASNNPVLDGDTLPSTEPVSANGSIDFSAGVADVILVTDDVGKYTIELEDISNTFADITIAGSSAVQTVRPFGLSITNIQGTNANSGASTPGGAIFATAGAPFSATVEAVLWSGADDINSDGLLDTGSFNNNSKAPGFAWNTILDTVLGGFTPAGSGLDLYRDTDQVVTLNQSEFETGGNPSVGTFTVTDLRYAEVGSFTLQGNVTDYLNTIGVDFSSDEIVVGRFIPASFRVEAPVNDGAFQNVNGTFTYIGQDFSYLINPSFTITALNALPTPTATTNYTGSWHKLSADSFSVNQVTADTTNNGSDALNRLVIFHNQAAIEFDPVTDDLGNGQFSVRFGNDTFCYGIDNGAIPGCDKESNSEVVEVSSADIDLTLTSIADNVTGTVEVTTNVNQLFEPSGNTLRFGRIDLTNSFGSELLPQSITIKSQYYNQLPDSTYIYSLNNADSTTAYNTATDIDLASTGNFTPPLTAADLGLTGSGTLSNGINTYSLHDDVTISEGPGVTGSVIYPVSVPSWLKYDWDGDGSFDDDPISEATFGIFGGNSRQIYYRQLYR